MPRFFSNTKDILYIFLIITATPQNNRVLLMGLAVVFWQWGCFPGLLDWSQQVLELFPDTIWPHN